MILPCKFCYGNGGCLDGLVRKPCPCCGGSGSIELIAEAGRGLIDCKFCYGNGGYLDGLERKPCPNCNGIGKAYPKLMIVTAQHATPLPKAQNLEAPRPLNFEYGVAISFAGEDRPTVVRYADALRLRGVAVFYDEYSQSDLWGEDLYAKLDDIYRSKARFCVLFISRHYARKLWTNHERQSAQARAFRENEAYILPVRLDDTELPGMRETVGYVDLRKTSLEHLVQLTIQKLSSN